MKRILLILSILMITGVSAQNTKIKGLTIDSDFYGIGDPSVRVQWDAKNSDYSQHKVKHPNFNQWAKTPANEGKWTTYGFQLRKNTLSDRTYQIKVTGKNGKVDKRKLRISKILAISPSTFRTTKPHMVYLNMAVSGNWNNTVGRTIYIGSNNSIGEIIAADHVGFGSWLSVSLDKEHGNEALSIEIKEEDHSYTWFKQRN